MTTHQQRPSNEGDYNPQQPAGYYQQQGYPGQQQPPGYYPPQGGYPQAPQPAPKRSNGLATAGFVVALIGAVFSVIPFVGVVSWGIAPVGLVLSVVGLFMYRSRRSGRGLATAGVVLAVFALIMCTVYAVSFAKAVSAPNSTAPVSSSSSSSAAPAYTYKVTGTGSASVTYTGKGGQMSQSTQKLPYTVTVPRDQLFSVGTVSATETGSSGPLACTIADETGKVVGQNSSDGGQFSSVSCSANGS